MNKTKIYLAGPLFSDAERLFDILIKNELSKNEKLDICWPGDFFKNEDFSKFENMKAEIFNKCSSELLNCDLIIAVLDGCQVDDGTAWEVGFAFANRIPIIGIRTDSRNAGETSTSKVNAMIEMACSSIVSSIDELKEILN